MKKITVLLTIALFSISISFCQEVKVGNKNFTVVKKTTLSTTTEYLQLKEKVAGNAGNASIQSYIKSNGVYNKTIFNEAEWQAFFKTGNLSSLGTIMQIKRGDNGSLKYITKNNTSVFVSGKNGVVHILECGKDIKTVMANINQSPERTACKDACSAIDKKCREDGLIINNEDGSTTDPCDDPWLFCLLDCDNNIPQQPDTPSSSYFFAFPKLAVKFQ